MGPPAVRFNATLVGDFRLRPLKFGLTTSRYWSTMGLGGAVRPMSVRSFRSVRAVRLAPVFGAAIACAAVLGSAGAAGPPTPAPNEFPISSGARFGGDDSPT